jgi:hypothetical protein
MAVVKEIPIEKRVTELEFKDVRREQHYNELKKDVENIDENVGKILTALVGSGLNNEMGLIYDVGQIKYKQKETETKIENIANRNTEYNVYFKILGIVSSTLLIATITLLFKIFSNTN